jgi:hypothetical protein
MSREIVEVGRRNGLFVGRKSFSLTTLSGFWFRNCVTIKAALVAPAIRPRGPHHDDYADESCNHNIHCPLPPASNPLSHLAARNFR